MNNFNLIVSTGTTFETQAECELWINLLAMGDPHPIIKNAGIPGLLLVKTSVDEKEAVKYFKEAEAKESILKTSPFNKQHRKNRGEAYSVYAQFIMKIIPIEKVVPSEIELISEKALELVKNTPICQDPNSKFRISIRKRQTNLETKDLIPPIADHISNAVDLQNFDWAIQIEIIGKETGISIITKDDLFEPLTQN